jgi:hypothetical protein
MLKALRPVLALFAVGVLGLGLAACGSSDSGGAVASGGGSTTTSTTAEMMSSDTTAMGDTQSTDMLTTNPCGMNGNGMMPGMESMKPAADAKAITITATEYKFSGTDALKAGGMFAVTFKNEGKELHELHVAKLPADEKRPLDQFLADPNAEKMVTTVGHSFACPGKAADAAGVDLSAKGRYVVACFIPTGATPATDAKDFDKLGKPHFMNGMLAEIDIT